MFAITELNMEIPEEAYKWQMERHLDGKIPTSSGYVYILEFQDGIKKVGWAKNLTARMYTLTRKLGEEFVLRYVISSDRSYELERQLHIAIKGNGIKQDVRGDEYYKMGESDIRDLLHFIMLNHESFELRSEGRPIQKKRNRVDAYLSDDKWFVIGKICDGRMTIPLKIRKLFCIEDGDEVVIRVVKVVKKRAR